MNIYNKWFIFFNVLGLKSNPRFHVCNSTVSAWIHNISKTNMSLLILAFWHPKCTICAGYIASHTHATKRGRLGHQQRGREKKNAANKSVKNTVHIIPSGIFFFSIFNMKLRRLQFQCIADLWHKTTLIKQSLLSVCRRGRWRMRQLQIQKEMFMILMDPLDASQ